MKTVDLLHELQVIDSRLDADRERLARVESELVDRSEYSAARSAYGERQATLQKVKAEQRDVELDVDSRRAHLTEVEQKLYGGKVRDAKELTNLNRDVDQLRSQIASREDRLMELLEGAEQATAELATAETHLRRVTAERRQRETALKEERQQLLDRISQSESAVAGLREQAPPAAVRTYDHLRRTRGGLAVAEVRQRTCQGCRITLTLGEEQRLRHGDALIPCQSCGRILYPS